MLALFCASLGIILYVYFGYPLLLWMGAFGRRQSFLLGDARPSVSVIVAAHNEESSIEAKLRNLLALDYPRDLVEILIGSDGSSDRTEDIVGAFMHEGVGLISFPKQQGKSAMQNGLVAAASGETPRLHRRRLPVIARCALAASWNISQTLASVS